MTLTDEQIKEIALTNPNKALITAGRTLYAKLRLHIDGLNLDSAITEIKGFEEAALKELRAKYARSNKDLIARALRPMDKVFSASGGSVYYNLPETADKKARLLSSNIYNGISTNEWVKLYWAEVYKRDPYGLLFMEVAKKRDWAAFQRQSKSLIYPTYKAITDVFDYKPAWNTLEYVFFNTTKEEKKAIGLEGTEQVYRVVDDARDVYVSVKDKEATVLTQTQLANTLGYCPAILNSDTPDITVNGGVKNLLSDVLEVADEFLLKGSVKLTYEFLHAFPKYWEYADSCPTCTPTDGGPPTGLLEGKSCPTCKGTGRKLTVKVSDVKLLEPPQQNDPILAPNVAGYVTPPADFHTMSNNGLALLEDVLYHTIWGTGDGRMKQQGGQMGQDGAKTATEVMGDMQPKIDRLHTISQMAENRAKFIINAAVRYQVAPAYGGVSLTLGKRYTMEPPDALRKRYNDAKMAGASTDDLDYLLQSLYEAEYANDPVRMAVLLKLMRVEPYTHFTIAEAKDLGLSDDDYLKKLYYPLWRRSLNDAMVLSYSEELLNESIAKFAAAKKAAMPAAVAPVVQPSNN